MSFHGRYQDAIRGKNSIFERKPLYSNAFDSKKARHILLAYTLSRAIDARRLELKAKSTEGSIITLEEEQLSLLRNLRFKSFLMAVISQAMEAIVQKKVDPQTLAFRPEAANAGRNSITDLIVAWIPVVNQVLSLVSAQVTPAQITERFSDETFLPLTVKTVSALLYSVKAAEQHAGFSAMLTDS